MRNKTHPLTGILSTALLSLATLTATLAAAHAGESHDARLEHALRCAEGISDVNRALNTPGFRCNPDDPAAQKGMRLAIEPRGKTIFKKYHCNDCHVFFSNGRKVDMFQKHTLTEYEHYLQKKERWSDGLHLKRFKGYPEELRETLLWMREHRLKGNFMVTPPGPPKRED